MLFRSINGISDHLVKGQYFCPNAVAGCKDVNLRSIADVYELTGSHIMNVVQYVCLTALEKGEAVIDIYRPSKLHSLPTVCSTKISARKILTS